MTNLNIDIHNPKISTPSEIWEYTKKEQKKREYDLAFCVVDGDVMKQGDLKTGSKVEFIISYPCFELWFLLHFKYTGREFYNCETLINSELKKHIPDYEKSQAYHSRKNFYEILKEKLNKAIDNAKKLEQDNKRAGRQKGTSTGIYKIIEKIFAAKISEGLTFFPG